MLPFGAVNTKNRFEFLGVDTCHRPISLKEIIVQARLAGAGLVGQRVKREMEFDVAVEVKAKIAQSTGKKAIFRQVIGILVLLRKNTKLLWTGEADPLSPPTAKSFDTPSEQISLTSDAPRDWVMVCNDINPIHISSLAAKLFGFSGKIAHGNHVVVLMVSKLGGELSKQEMGKLIWDSQTPCFVEVAFKCPMVLPIFPKTKFAVESASGVQNSRFFEAVGKDDKTHVEGSWGVL